MFTVFLFIVCSCAIVLLFISYNKLKGLQYHNILLTKKLNQLNKTDKIKFDIPKKTNSTSNIFIRFIPTVYKNGVISKNCRLLLTPIEYSEGLKELKVRDHVEIIDKCECNDIVWFYIKVFDSNEINNKGWVVSHNINTSLEHLPAK